MNLELKIKRHCSYTVEMIREGTEVIENTQGRHSKEEEISNYLRI
jgi:hypothetical protein